MFYGTIVLVILNTYGDCTITYMYFPEVLTFPKHEKHN